MILEVDPFFISGFDVLIVSGVGGSLPPLNIDPSMPGESSLYGLAGCLARHAVPGG
jgi:hypothetical protein